MKMFDILFRYAVAFLALLLLWQVGAWALGPYLLPAPPEVLEAWAQSLHDPVMRGHVTSSAMRVGAAMTLAFVVAFPLGILLGYRRRIDRYVSPDAPTLDPRTLVTRHLPLIAKNFPNLDILAISALGDADSTFGLDNLLARCLIDTPTVQQTLTAIKSTHALFGQELIAFCKHPGLEERDALDAALNHYKSNTKCLDAHWFLPRTMLEQSGKLLSAKDLEDFHTLRKRLRLVGDALPAGQYARSVEAMIGAIRMVHPQGAVGRQWQETLIAHLTELVADTRRGQAIDRQWMFAAWAVGAMTIIAWTFVLIYA